MISLLEDRAAPNPVAVEQSSCLGWCKRAPCVAVTHDDYEGRIGLVGMDESEINQSMFFNVLWEEDAERIWNAVANAVRELDEEEEDG